jgi:anti-sigma B factor antagonist
MGGYVNLSCAVDAVGGLATVTPVGDVGVDSTSSLRDAIQTAMGQPGIAEVVVNLAGVTFLDSSALSVLIAARKSCRQRGLAFGVRDPGPIVTMVLRITGLFDVLIVPTHGWADPADHVIPPTADSTNRLSPA